MDYASADQSTRALTTQQSTVMPGRKPYRQIVDGVPRSPWINAEVFRKNQSFRAAEGDVVQCQYAKSGTNWVQYISQLIIKRGKEINYAEFTRDFRGIEYMDCADWIPTLPVRLFFTHLPLRHEMMNEKAKYIYVARNPWDVCVSLFRMVTDVSIYRFQDGKFEDFFDSFIDGDLGYGDYFDHVSSGYALRDKPNLFFVTYEDLKTDTRSTVIKLAHFLGDEYGRALLKDEQALQNVLEYSKAENMRKVIVHELGGNETREWNDMMTGKKISCKHGYGGDQSKFSIVKEARVGSWKDHFTPELFARFEKKIKEKGDSASFMELWSNIREEAIALSRTPA